MEKRMIVAVICLLLVLVACESKTTGKRVAIPEKAGGGITGNVVGDTTEPKPASTVETVKTAAEVLKELQSTGSITATSGAKSGTFYPPVITDATGKDALKAKTRALMTSGTYDPNVQADDEFGARYHDKDGDLTNLPGNYSDDTGD